jgi:integrase/recombinase XerD
VTGYTRMLLAACIEPFAKDCLSRGRSPRTVESQVCYLRKFVEWCAAEEVRWLDGVTLDTLEAYRQHLWDFRKPRTDEPLSIDTRANRLVALKAFFKRMCVLQRILRDPTRDLEIVRDRNRLVGDTLSHDEVVAIMRQALVRGRHGVRDRAILETFYASGGRCQEVCSLDLHDIDFHGEWIRIRHGKGRKERVVPLAESTALWLGRYITQLRPRLLQEPPTKALFINNRGGRFSRASMTSMVRRYRDLAGIEKRGATRLFRRTAATRMIENGAQISYVQAYLGHADISTTQVYVKTVPTMLREVVQKTHPGFSERSTGDRRFGEPD